MLSIGALAILSVIGIVSALAGNVHAAEAFTFKITVWALGADSDMGNM